MRGSSRIMTRGTGCALSIASMSIWTGSTKSRTVTSRPCSSAGLRGRRPSSKPFAGNCSRGEQLVMSQARCVVGWTRKSDARRVPA